MPRINYSDYGETPFQQLLGYNKQLTEKWNSLGDILSSKGTLTEELKEQVRRVLAFGNKCEYCMAKGKPNKDIKDERMSTAMAFAEIFLHHRTSINDATFDVLRSVFNEREISELCAFICFTTASQQFGAIMNLKSE